MTELWTPDKNKDYCDISISVSPYQRDNYLKQILEQDGLYGVKEDPRAAYLPISLTAVPQEMIPELRLRQRFISEVLEEAGISSYDPATAPFSPDIISDYLPSDIYSEDTLRIAMARYMVGWNITPSTGKGEEIAIGQHLNRIGVEIMDPRVKVSRMQPPRFIYLAVSNLEEARGSLVRVFKRLNEFTPAVGKVDNEPALIGCSNEGGEVVALDKLIYGEFPELRYSYDGTVPALELHTAHPLNTDDENSAQLLEPYNPLL
jgi:hypothetical protein